MINRFTLVPLLTVLLLGPVAAAAQPYRIYRYRTPIPQGTPRTVTRSSSSVAAPSQEGRTGPFVVSKAASISAPGSYVLGANVNAADDLNTGAIVITSPNVTLDLGGFSVRGRGAESPDACGIAILADNVTVRNGSVAEFDRANQCGVLVASGVASFCVESLSIVRCETGIILNPDNADPARNGRIEQCRISGGAVGLLAFASVGVSIANCEITGAAPRHNLEGEGSGALLRGEGFRVEDCTLSGNGHGLRVEAENCLVRNVVCSGNRNTGMYVTGARCFVSDSSLSGNGIMGINICSVGCRLESVLSGGNGAHGISLDAGEGMTARCTAVVGCQLTENGGNGLLDKGAGNTLVENCCVTANGATGASLGTAGIYRGCYFAGNGMAPVSGGKDGGGNVHAEGQ